MCCLRLPVCAGKPHTPAVFPTVNHLPTFNTMAMFTVMPGKSFHAVQVKLMVEGRLLLAQPGSWPQLKHQWLARRRILASKTVCYTLNPCPGFDI